MKKVLMIIAALVLALAISLPVNFVSADAAAAYYGEQDPTASAIVANVGDYYFMIGETFKVFVYTSTDNGDGTTTEAWTLSYDVAEREEAASVMHHGESAPTAELGANGDYYMQITTTASAFEMYKKIEGEWKNIGALYFTVASTGDDTSSSKSNWVSYVMIGAIVVILILMLYLPRRRQKKQQDDLMKQVKVGAVVTTVGGIIGTITDLSDGEFTIETGDGDNKSTMRYAMQAIYMVHPDKESAKAEADQETTNEIK
ncbi:MAG: preprotein translocase subunit YajC [Clostridia bacterium]|nr:preprotein translocase subunit YajC [Clostridia bacterium]